MTTCTRCKRALKDPVSIQRGYGPICWNKHLAEQEKESCEMNDLHIDEPIDEFIIIERRPEGVATNVPHLVTHHSPTGFEFGYGGSGPADLALNILEVILRDMHYEGERTNDTWKGDTCYKLAYALHQPFKWDFIASMNRAGGKIYTNDIVSWIETHKPMFEDSVS